MTRIATAALLLPLLSACVTAGGAGGNGSVDCAQSPITSRYEGLKSRSKGCERFSQAAGTLSMTRHYRLFSNQYGFAHIGYDTAGYGAYLTHRPIGEVLTASFTYPKEHGSDFGEPTAIEAGGKRFDTMKFVGEGWKTCYAFVSNFEASDMGFSKIVFGVACNLQPGMDTEHLKAFLAELTVSG